MKNVCYVLYDTLPTGGHNRDAWLLPSVRHQNTSGGVTFLGNLDKSYDNCFATRSRFLYHCIRDALRYFAFLIGRPAFEHGDLDKRHRISSQFSIVKIQFSVVGSQFAMLSAIGLRTVSDQHG